MAFGHPHFCAPSIFIAKEAFQSAAYGGADVPIAHILKLCKVGGLRSGGHADCCRGRGLRQDEPSRHLHPDVSDVDIRSSGAHVDRQSVWWPHHRSPGPDEPILTVTGGSTPLKLTMDQLNALGRTSMTVDEPFVKKRQTFTGVPLATVLARAGIPDTASIDTVALNAYHYSSAVGPLVASSALSPPSATTHRSHTTRADPFGWFTRTARNCPRCSTRGTGVWCR